MLLKMVILVKRENLIKGTRPYEYIRCLIFKEKMRVPTTLLLFWITQGSPSSASPYFWSKKYIAFSTIRNCMLKGIWNLELSIYLSVGAVKLRPKKLHQLKYLT